MNKWQIICPVVTILIVGILAASQHGRSQTRGMRAAIDRHLGTVLGELENRQESGRFPSVQSAQSALQDEAVAKRVHVTSLFTTDSLYYNPNQPVIGSDALVLCARVREALWGIQADRKVRRLAEAEVQEAHLVLLSSRAELNGAADGSQPFHSDTNRTSPAAGSRR